MSAGVGVDAWLATHPDHQVIAVLIAPSGRPGTFETMCVGPAGSAETLIATVALLEDLADRVRERLDVAGSPQILARAEHCRRLLLSELAQ